MEAIAGRRVLVVEEGSMVRMLLADMLGEFGCAIAGETGSLRQAMTLASDADFDVAILDVMVNGMMIYPVADVVRGRGLPFVLATGLAASALPERYRNRPSLKKPFEVEDVKRILADALHG